MSQPIKTFNDKNTMPQLGTGIWQVDADEADRVVSDAIEIGYRLIDGARAYQNEEAQGEGIRASGVDRSELFVTTKLWNSDQGYEATMRAFDASLKRLGLDYLDLYLIHWPYPQQDLYVESWKAMIELRDQGRIRSIGVANFHEAHLKRLIEETGVTPALNQIELHPTLNQTAMRKVNDRLGIVTQSWTPLGRGDFELPAVREIAERLNATPAQVVLAWHLRNGLSVIPKSAHKERLAENFGALDVTLSDADMKQLDALDSGARKGPDPDTMNETMGLEATKKAA